MNDMQSSQLNSLIKSAKELGVYLSIIGVGIDFNSNLTESIIKNEGCNYFSITDNFQMTETIVQDFHYNFFESALNLFLKVQSDEFELTSLYGTQFDNNYLENQDIVQQFEEHKEINIGDAQKQQQHEGQQENKPVCVAEINTVTSSPLVSENYMTGGVILLKFKQKAQNVVKDFKGKIKLQLTYKDRKKTKSYCQDYEVEIVQPEVQQAFYENEAVQKALLLKKFVNVSKKMMDFRISGDTLKEFEKCIKLKQIVFETEKDLNEQVEQFSLFKNQFDNVLKSYQKLKEQLLEKEGYLLKLLEEDYNVKVLKPVEEEKEETEQNVKVVKAEGKEETEQEQNVKEKKDEAKEKVEQNVKGRVQEKEKGEDKPKQVKAAKEEEDDEEDFCWDL